jgi:endonuclease YncB( thermonuclease family)
MRRVFLVGLLTLPLFPPLTAAAATVISVGDGDTLRVDDGGRAVTIRLACIDAPEMAQAPHGQRARQALQEMLPVGSAVTLKVQTSDRYGRSVAEVVSRNGRNVGLALVQQGNAYAYRRYLGQCDQWTYLDREKLAQRYRAGIWRLDGGIERPWDFRAARRSGPRLPTGRPVTLTILHDPSPSTGVSYASTSGRRWRCREVGSWERAQQLLRQGHTYLDGDSDGEACEALR